MDIHLFIEFSAECDVLALERALRSTGLPLDIHAIPGLAAGEPDTTGISILARVDPVDLVKAVVDFFRQLAPVADGEIIIARLFSDEN